MRLGDRRKEREPERVEKKGRIIEQKQREERTKKGRREGVERGEEGREVPRVKEKEGDREKEGRE
jgi:hypothetical protein